MLFISLHINRVRYKMKIFALIGAGIVAIFFYKKLKKNNKHSENNSTKVFREVNGTAQPTPPNI